MRTSSSYSAIRSGGHLTINDAAKRFGNKTKNQGAGRGKYKREPRDGFNVVQLDKRQAILIAIWSTELVHMTRKHQAMKLLPEDPKAMHTFLDWLAIGTSTRKSYTIPGYDSVEQFLDFLKQLNPR
jgi:hypothetical protein